VRRGPLYRAGRITIGVIVHGDSTVSGHGPGVTPLLTGPAELLRPQRDEQANLARVLEVRTPVPPQQRRTLAERDRHLRCVLRDAPPQLAFDTAMSS
jgi:hypothetical protein